MAGPTRHQTQAGRCGDVRELAVAASKAQVKTDKSLWQMLTTIALLVLLVEWWYYQRRPGGFSP